LEDQQKPPETEIPETDNPDDTPDDNHGDDPDPGPVPPNLTVFQFLKRSPQKPGIGGLIRSLHSSEIKSFEEWEKETASLLKKRTK
jgi:hypothetical protein